MPGGFRGDQGKIAKYPVCEMLAILATLAIFPATPGPVPHVSPFPRREGGRGVRSSGPTISAQHSVSRNPKSALVIT